MNDEEKWQSLEKQEHAIDPLSMVPESEREELRTSEILEKGVETLVIKDGFRIQRRCKVDEKGAEVPGTAWYTWQQKVIAPKIDGRVRTVNFQRQFLDSLKAVLGDDARSWVGKSVIVFVKQREGFNMLKLNVAETIKRGMLNAKAHPAGYEEVVHNEVIG